jgi:hypothetical protein
LLLLLAIVLLPHHSDSPTPGDDLVRNTVRLALFWYALAAALMLLEPSSPSAGRHRLARWCWTLACLTYLVHVGLAFHYFHHWSHAQAFDHVQQVSGVGAGIFVSYLFTIVWCADVAFWWLWPERRALCPRWLGWSLHLFMVFVIVNATVVFETGPIRWAGLTVLCALAAAFGAQRGAAYWRLARRPDTLTRSGPAPQNESRTQ